MATIPINVIEMLNSIRAEAGQDYADRIPEATVTNISNVGNAIISYTPAFNIFCDMLVNRISFEFIHSMMFTNPLSSLKKGSVAFGGDIQEITTNPAKAETFDPTGATLLNRKIPDVKAIYHRMNRMDTYTVSVSEDQLQAAFNSVDSLGRFISSIINSAYSGDAIDEFTLTKKTIGDAITANKIVTASTPLPVDKETAEKFVKAVKAISFNFTMPSTAYNKYFSFKPVTDTGEAITTWCPRENQIILIRGDILQNIDVDVLAQAFNLDKVEFLPRMIGVDDFGTSEKTMAVIADEATFQLYDKKFIMTDFYNPKALYRSYFLNHWQTLSISLFTNAVALLEPTEG